MPQMGNFLTLKQAAEEIGISAKALRKRCANRELPHYRVTCAIQIKKEDLLAFIEKQRVECFED